MAHLVQLWLENQRYWFRILVGSDVYHRGCAYIVLQTVQRPGVRSVVYVIKHYKEPLKSFDKSRVYIIVPTPEDVAIFP